MFERSLNDGEVPELIRQTIVVPIHKKGDKAKPSNKRNISLTCSSYKLFEQVISVAILDNAVRQGAICEEQHAYRNGHSCCTQLLLYQNDVAALVNEGSFFDVVMFDFKSAFELTTHAKLLDCLSAIGDGDKLIGWIRVFLTGRSFRVAVGKELSSTAYTTHRARSLGVLRI